MKHSLTFLALVLGMLMLTACHSSEANYKAAYDKAMEKHRDGIGAEEYERILAEQQKPTMVVNGDSVRVVPLLTNVTDDSLTVARRYGVVVAQFKQKFNAITMRDRLRREEGFPSYVVFGGNDRKYYVIVKAFDQLDVAVAFLKNIDRSVKMKILEPKAWIMERL
ncbi:MAG: SPOR domain-containing protein [Muribaculaceae bacterium]|nr:SPOR domain-containing protein [Muribaculaceae bacterium]